MAAQSNGSSKMEAPSPESEKQVLVVDDDPQIARYLERLLNSHGYQSTVCSDGALVINALNLAPYSCVLLDIQLKNLEGTELLPIIKHRFSNLPVILVSAFLDSSNTGYYSSLGAFDFISKPFSKDRLLDSVDRAVGSRTTIPITLNTLSLNTARDQIYRKLIVTALSQTDWNQVKASKLLGISRYSLRRWLHRLSIIY